METLAQKDIRRLFDSLIDLYAFRNHDEFVRHLLSNLPSLLACDIIAYNEYDLKRPESVFAEWAPSEAIPHSLLPIFQERLHENPVARYFQETGDGQALKVSDFLSRIHFHRLGLYSEFYRPCHVEHLIVSALHTSRDHIIAMGFGRPLNDFSEKDRLLLNLLRPHLTQAFQNASAVTRIHSQISGLSKTTEDVSVGVLEVSSKGHIEWATPRAMDCLRMFWPHESPDRTQQIPASLMAWIQQSEAEFHNPSEVPRPQQPFIKEQGKHTLTIRTLHREGQRFLHLEEHGEEMTAQSLGPLGLEPRQSEVLMQVARGYTNQEIATALGISIKTVKKHLERIFQRLGVETRTAAAARAMECWKTRLVSS